MILPAHGALRAALTELLVTQYGLSGADLPPIVIETPPRRTLGDLATPVAFELARRLRQAPRAIAQALAAGLGAIDGVHRIEAAPNGHLNFFLARPAMLIRWLADRAPRPAAADGKIVVEHTAVNPNKAAHIGHLRNAALGDTLVRLLRFQGHEVEVQNYIDDTGVQVADVVVGFLTLEPHDAAAVAALAADPSVRFDYLCWDLYARVGEWYEADRSRLAVRAEALQAIEHGAAPHASIAAIVADRIVRCHLRTMARMNVGYDLLTWEGDILRLQFWTTAFEQLRERGAVFLQQEGRLKGCWVMAIEGGGPAGDEPAGEDDEPREKVIVRSNGTVTYVGKDIANQFWKFGLLDRDFHYRRFDVVEGRTIWATTATAADHPEPAPRFGHASAVYNVIDSRQSYLQDLLQQALRAMGYVDQAGRSTHFSYEMVALSHQTARSLGYPAAAGDDKPFVEVSGRKGFGVKADDLLDRLAETARREVVARNPELSAADAERTAAAIATAAVRYFLVKFTRGKLIVFDVDEALSFEGETGPYLQYAVVRARNILAKLAERNGTSESDVIDRLPTLPAEPLEEGEEADELWNLVLEAARLDEVADAAVRSLELSTLAKYAFGLAQAFNAFYHRQQIVREEREDARLWRAAAVVYVRRQLTAALDVMGCQVPDRM